MRDSLFHVVPNRFQNTNLQSHWLSGISQNCTANELANSYFEICLERRETRQERIPHHPMQKFNKYGDVFGIFFVLRTNLFHK